MKDWAVEKLSVFLGFDPETLEEQVYPYLMSLNTSNELVEHLTNLLGTDESTMQFIQEFSTRRFPPTQPALANPRAPQAVSSSKPTSRTSSADNSRSASPQSQARSSTEVHEPSFGQSFSNEQNVYRKKDVEDNYFVGTRKAKKEVKPNAEARIDQQPSVTSSETAHSSTTKATGNGKSMLISDKLAPKKKKGSEIMNLEDALKELNIMTNVSDNKKRQACNCQATKHELLSISPNCLTCGKIICVKEGPGPCTFCGTPVLSKEQQLELIAEAKRKRAEAAREKNRQLNKKSTAPSKSQGMARYASKLGGSIISDSSDDWLGPAEWEEQQRKAEESRLAAEMHKEKLLDFQRTSAKRTTVIDQATDYELPSDGGNIWLSPQERAMQVKKQQSNLKRLDNTGKRKVMTIDLATRNVIMEEAPEPDESEDEYEGIKMTPAQRTYLERQKEAKSIRRPTAASPTQASSGTFANNPFLNRTDAPTFIRGVIPAKTDKKKSTVSEKGESSKPKPKQTVPSRVQDDSNSHGAEHLLIGGEDGSRDIVIEPIRG
ncbi:hypothetical protein K450DRAFT_241102 [Umbelopsis ramanniana AG]|uniref:TRIP4/RQT4 C2HC5-type zinc finger domain-containing protein n=1 Tax=Umbelopsis ramanniana AG TaxID=1314678 RepID=A0AAD5HEL0_UMBRA|nr:uncharacterized protein K450DRAFT_241102 [Umbelopsis ramanniana AG]KAI8579706.1 hypothetical protein K450DRAFT_241102 [Umbelopsis ramanniana AG]